MLVRLAWRNLWRGWRRSLIVLCAFTVGIAASLLLVAWTRGMGFQMADTAIRTRLAHIAVHARGYDADPDPSRALPDGGAAVLAAAEARYGVRAAPRLAGDGLVQSARSSLRANVLGVDPLREPGVSVVPASLVEGEWLPARPPTSGSRRLRPVVIGQAMAERLRLGVGDKLVLHVPGETGLGAFRVLGLYATASSEFDKAHAYLSLADAQRLLGVGDGVTEVALALDDPDDAVALQRELSNALAARASAGPVEVLRWEERAPQLAALRDLIGSTAWIFYAAVFVAMAFGIANVLLMSVLERTREFGVLRSIGLGARRLVALVLVESLLLSLLGVLAGLGLGVPFVLWLGVVGLDLSMFAEGLRSYGVGAVMYPAIGSEDLVSPVLLAVGTAFVAALWPAVKVARLRPAEALRHS
jgi:ABC-type lipoprotein release transport system permease subunit